MIEILSRDFIYILKDGTVREYPQKYCFSQNKTVELQEKGRCSWGISLSDDRVQRGRTIYSVISPASLHVAAPMHGMCRPASSTSYSMEFGFSFTIFAST